MASSSEPPYLTDEGVRSYFAEIDDSTNCCEVTVDHLWLRMLIIHFPWDGKYLYHREDYAPSDSQIRSNVSLEILFQGRRCKAIVFENKRPSQGKTGMPHPASWTSKQNQLLSYMMASRTQQGPLPFSMLGAVCIGKLVKFFELRNGENKLQPFQGQSKPLHLQTEAQVVHQKILAMKEIIDNARKNQST